MLPDSELLLRCAAADATAMRELTGRYEPRLRQLLFRVLGDADDVEDVLVDVFLRLWRNAPRFRGECEVSTWIYRLATTAATDMLRSRRKARRQTAPLEAGWEVAAPPSCGPEQSLLAREEETRCRAAVAAALERLTPEQRVVITLYYFENLSYREIAAVTGVAQTTVRMRLFCGRRKMLSYIQESLKDDGTIPVATWPPLKCGISPCAGGDE
jgi:RNA polymerase sigma-70 factor (ECF subfamily)